MFPCLITSRLWRSSLHSTATVGSAFVCSALGCSICAFACHMIIRCVGSTLLAVRLSFSFVGDVAPFKKLSHPCNICWNPEPTIGNRESMPLIDGYSQLCDVLNSPLGEASFRRCSFDSSQRRGDNQYTFTICSSLGDSVLTARPPRHRIDRKPQKAKL